MRTFTPILLMTALLMLGCGEPEHDHESTMPGMTADEHGQLKPSFTMLTQPWK